MNTEKKFIASDFDGTIAAEGKYEENIRAVSKWRARGNYFGIVTGRNLKSFMSSVSPELEYDFLICNNGAVSWIRTESGLKRLFLLDFDSSLLPSLMNYAGSCGMLVFGLSTLKDDLFMGADQLERARLAGNLHFTDSLLPEGILWRIRRLKRIVQFTPGFGSLEKCMETVNGIRRKFDGVFEAYPSGHSIDCVRFGVSKADGVSRTAEHFGIPRRLCFTVGDGHNDVSMLEEFGGFAVSGAPDEVKHRADATVSSVAEMIDMLL